MGAVTSCKVCHFNTRTALEKAPKPQVAVKPDGNKRGVAATPTLALLLMMALAMAPLLVKSRQ